jgi:KAP family P-loop domain
MADTETNPAAQVPLTIAANAVGDQPTDEDTLGFGPYVEAITAFLTSEATQPPLTMSIEGEWGSGKSSFMLQLEKAIRGPSRTDVFIQKLPQGMGGLGAPGSLQEALRAGLRRQQRLTVQFNAWRHDKQDALWAAFALTFTKRLRKQVGLFRRWKGDLSLFVKRLKGLRGWAELLLLIVSLLCLAIGVAGLIRFVKTHPTDDIRQVISSITSDPHTPAQPVDKKKDSKQLSEPYEFLLSHGKWGALLALAILGFLKLRQMKLPLTINLEKYLSKPDYEGHASFIETFHEDFSRVVKAYAKDRRVFIFVDDLDRCDVPRAAELMQAINLMIGNAGKLVFILGMDREKVAAGIAQKYKELLSFIPMFASADAEPGSQLGSLYFGYSYLQKFIQLSFTLPAISDTQLLMRFLSSMNRNSVNSVWFKRLTSFWSTQAKASVERVRRVHVPPSATQDAAATVNAGSTTASGKAVAQARRVSYLRVKVEKDSERLFQIASMVSAIFENNPRKLKQFINTFRLSLFLASTQGIFDQEESVTPVTPEQLGKFVALTLRFPDLRSLLAGNPELLEDLEASAQTSPNELKPSLKKWLVPRGVKDILLFGIDLGGDPFDRAMYSLKAFPVRKMLSILPNVPEMPNQTAAEVHSDPREQGSDNIAEQPTYSELARPLELLGQRYEEIRKREQAGPDRTQHMTRVFDEATQKASALSPDAAQSIIEMFLSKNNSGARLMAIAIATVQPSRANIPWLLKMLDDYKSPFEHYDCIRVLLRYSHLLSTSDYKFILQTLDKHWTKIKRDPGRIVQAELLRQTAQRETVELSVASSQSGGFESSAFDNAAFQTSAETLLEPANAHAKLPNEIQKTTQTASDELSLIESRLVLLDPKERPVYEEALKLLLREGSASDHFALRFLRAKNLASNWVGVFSGLQRNTNLVQPVPGQPEKMRLEEKEWQIKADLKSAVAAYFRGKEVA